MEAVDLIGLGDDPALEFVNTTAPLPDGSVLELIGEGAGYLFWLERIGLIDSADLAMIHATLTPAQLDDVAADARALREWLRPVVAAWAGARDKTLPAEVVERLNTILEGDHRFTRIHEEDREPVLHEHRHWTQPRQLLVPPIHAAATLLAEGDQYLVRNCEGCSMWFYDHTKAHRRRWCSMALCGNRAKVRSHRERASAVTTRS